MPGSSLDARSWSLSELKALAIKAARGAGLSYGLAEESGGVVTWLVRRGLPGTQALAVYLSGREAGLPWTEVDALPLRLAAATQPYCPLSLGAALSDNAAALGDVSGVELGQVYEPWLLVPAVEGGVLGGDVVLQWDVPLESRERSATDGGFILRSASCRVTPGDGSPRIAPSHVRVGAADAAHVRCLEQLAAKTYAPVTEESRLRGAGAGLNDND